MVLGLHVKIVKIIQKLNKYSPSKQLHVPEENLQTLNSEDLNLKKQHDSLLWGYVSSASWHGWEWSWSAWEQNWAHSWRPGIRALPPPWSQHSCTTAYGSRLFRHIFLLLYINIGYYSGVFNVANSLPLVLLRGIFEIKTVKINKTTG